MRPVFLFFKFFLLLWISFFLFVSCNMLKSSGDLTNGTVDSVLNGIVGGAPLLPPKDLSSIGYFLDSGPVIEISWGNVEFAYEYKVYRSDSRDGEFILLGGVDSTRFRDSVSLSTGASSVSYYYSVKAVNSNSISSGFSVPVEGKLIRDAIFDGKVLNVLVSKGREDGISVRWTPSEGAAYFKIERSFSGLSDFVTIKEDYIPTNPDAEEYFYFDSSVPSALYCDYRVTPFDRFGGAGITSSVALKGFSYPGAEQLIASHGHYVRGDVSGSDFSMIELSWRVKSSILNSAGENFPILPDSWWTGVVYSPSSSVYNNIVDIVDPLFAGDDVLKPLAEYASSDSRYSHLTDGLIVDGDNDVDTNPESWTHSSTIDSLFFRKIYDNESERFYYSYRQRFWIDDMAVTGEFSSSWNREKPIYYYFKISAIYNEHCFNEYSTPLSSISRGFAADPTAYNFDDSSIAIISSWLPSSGVSIQFNKMEEGSPATEISKYRIYRRELDAFNYTLKAEIIASGLDTYEAFDASAKEGVTYCYALSFIGANSLESHFTAPVIISIPKGGE